MTISIERIQRLMKEYRDKGGLVLTQHVVDSLQRLIDEEANQMDTYYAEEAAKYGYEANS